jgi:hypothetical protein
MIIALNDLKRTENQPEPGMFRGELRKGESVGEGTPKPSLRLELYHRVGWPPNDVLEVRFELDGYQPNPEVFAGPNLT